MHQLFLIILPAAITYIAFFIPSLDYSLRIILSLAIIALYLTGLTIYFKTKINKADKQISDLQGQVKRHSDFLHNRQLFIKHDLTKLKEIILEYRGHVVDTYREKKFQRLRDEARLFKDKTVEIIDKEMRDFDEQLHNVQGNKDN